MFGVLKISLVGSFIMEPPLPVNRTHYYSYIDYCFLYGLESNVVLSTACRVTGNKIRLK